MSVLVKPLQTFKKWDKNFNFSNYGKAHKYICGVQVSGHYVSHVGAKIGAQTGDIKIDFK